MRVCRGVGEGRHNSQSSNKKRERKGRLREDWLGSELGREIKKGREDGKGEEQDKGRAGYP